MTLQLPVYDPAKHQFGLGQQGQTIYGLMLSGAYRKALRRNDDIPEAFGGRPPTPVGPITPHPPAFSPPNVAPAPPQPPAARPPSIAPAPPVPPSFLPPSIERPRPEPPLNLTPSPNRPQPVPPNPPPGPAPPPPPTPAAGGPQAAVGDLIHDDPGTYQWTQDDYSGGIFQFNWRQDGGMLLGSGNMAPRPFDKSLRTIPPLASVTTYNVGNERPLLVFAVDDQICAVFAQASGLLRYNISTGASAWHPLPGTPTAATKGPTAAAFDDAERVLYVGHFGRGVGTNGSGAIWRFDCSNLAALAALAPVPLRTNQLFLSPIDQVASFPVGISVGGGALVVAYATVSSSTLLPIKGITVWSGRLPDDTEDASKQPTWTRVGDLGGQWKGSVLYNGFIYILTSGRTGNTKLVAVDLASDQILPIADFPYNFKGEALKVLGGRLYVGGSATDLGSSARFAELHEVTGNSMRLVRSFGDEYRNTGAAIKPDSIYALEAYEGMLWFGVGTTQLVCYDPQNDAFYGGSSLRGFGTVGGMGSSREGLYSWLMGAGTNDGFYRIALAGDTMTAWNGQVITSDFAPFIDEVKDWQTCRVFTRYGGVTLQVTQDGGATLSAPMTGTPVVDGNNRLTTFDLTGLADGRRIRLVFALDRGTGVTGFTELVSHSLTYKRPNPPAPVNTNGVTISGTYEKGGTLYIDRGDWDNQPTLFTYQWRRCDSSGGACVNVGGNTINYFLTQADVGKTIRCIVTATNSGGSTSVTSAQTPVIAASTAPPNPPQAEFVASIVYGAAPLVAAFTDLSAFDEATSWAWDFGDSISGCFMTAATGQIDVPTVHNLQQGQAVSFTTTATLPSPLVAGTIYYVVDIGIPSSFKVSLVPNGAALVFSGGTTGLPVHTLRYRSAAQHPVHEYVIPGTYTVTLVATNASGSSTRVKTNYITAKLYSPEVEFTASAVYGETPLTVVFTDLSLVQAPTGWTWNFGDGSAVSHAQHPIHVYSTPGLYNVTLTVTNAIGAGTKTKTGYVLVTKTAPRAEFAVSAVYGAVPLVVAFTDLSDFEPTTWDWNFGDGTAHSSAQHPNHVYDSPGSYTVTLTATNSAGNGVKVKTAFITATSGTGSLHAEFVSSTVYGSPPLVVAFTDLSGGDPTSWLWDFGDGTIGTPSHTAQHPVHVYESEGVFDVTLTVTNATDTKTKEKVGYVTVRRYPPQAEFTASAVYGRVPLTVAFTDLSDFDRPTAWDWDFGDGSAHSHDQHPFHTYSAAGTYTVTLIATNATGSSTKTKTNYIHVEPKISDRHAWSVVVCGSDRIENLLGEEELYNLELLRDELWRFVDNDLTLTMTDLDGEQWSVRLVSVEQTNPLVMLPVTVEDPDSTDSSAAREAFYQLTLVEKV